jgi:hypothetical protein
MKPSGIEPATFQFVAQKLNHCATADPHMLYILYIKTFKTLPHVSILRSSSRSIHCSLLKLYVKIISELLRYINPVMWQHIVCLFVRCT